MTVELIFVGLLIVVSVLGYLGFKANESAARSLAASKALSVDELVKLRSFIEKGFEDIEKRSVQLTKETQLKVVEVPVKVLNTIQGSVNTTTGKLAELIQFLTLQASYDRLIPVGSVIDFIGIRFPREGIEPALDFIEIKAGPSARMSDDQKRFRILVNEHKDKIALKVVKTEVS